MSTNNPPLKPKKAGKEWKTKKSRKRVRTRNRKQ